MIDRFDPERVVLHLREQGPGYEPLLRVKGKHHLRFQVVLPESHQILVLARTRFQAIFYVPIRFTAVIYYFYPKRVVLQLREQVPGYEPTHVR